MISETEHCLLFSHLESLYFNGLAQGGGSPTLEVSTLAWLHEGKKYNIPVPVWAATTTSEDYLRMEGMKRVIDDPVHRKEVVSGNMYQYLTARTWTTASLT